MAQSKQCTCRCQTSEQRIIIAKFNGNPETIVIVQYSLRECTDNAIKHFSTSDVIKQAPKYNFLKLIADFNAHIGCEIEISRKG